VKNLAMENGKMIRRRKKRGKEHSLNQSMSGLNRTTIQ